MKYILMTLFVAFLFFILTPGVLVVLPPNMFGPNAVYVVAATHAVIFAVLYHFIKRMIWNALYENENSSTEVPP